MWGTEVPPEHSHTSAPQEVVQGRLPHRSGGPPISPTPGSSHTCTKTAAPRRVATHLSPAVPPRADLTHWSFSASVSTTAASLCHQLIRCAKQHLYIESCSHAG